MTDLFHALGIADAATGGTLSVLSPIDGAEIGRVHPTDSAAMPGLIARAQEAFRHWREVPAPVGANSSGSSARNCARPRPSSAPS